MMGRGCRLQGEIDGFVVMVDKVITKESIAWETIKSRQKEQHPESVKNLRHIAECFEHLK